MITVKWSRPTTRSDVLHTPLAAADIIGYDLQMMAQGAPDFTSLSDVPITDTQFLIDTNVPGTYSFRCVALTKEGRGLPASGMLTIEAPVPALAVADAPQNFTITLS